MSGEWSANSVQCKDQWVGSVEGYRLDPRVGKANARGDERGGDAGERVDSEDGR